MKVMRRYLAAVCAISLGSAAFAQEPPASPALETIAAVVESTLATGGRQIRQLAFDGDDKTYFQSAGKVAAKDHFTLLLDKPVSLKSISVVTGRPADPPAAGEAAEPVTPGDPAATVGLLQAGALEVSTDGKTFAKIADFAGGAAKATPEGAIQAIRIQPSGDQEEPMAVREIVLEATPAVATFKYPIEINVVTTDAPELQEWAEKVARICERSYTMINDELQSEGFKPPQQVTMTLSNSYRGVAAASGGRNGGRIVGSVSYFKSHQDDIGAMVHETTHIAQSYRGRGNPGWLVEGVADYVRFFKYEPGKIGKLNVERARYNASYRTTAAFLNYLVEKYDKQIVNKLNKAMREGAYKESLFKDYTGKEVTELDAEWRATLMPAAN